jgi:hypothetical protein
VVEEVPTVLVSATPTRRFNKGSGRTSAVIVSSFSQSGSGRSKEYKPNRRSQGQTSSAAAAFQPTPASSIYRFKLNRPTGRWRFKPSPKPKVNIIKTKDEVEDETEGVQEEQHQKENSPVYHKSELEGELQHPEETRTDSNELVQEIEPELAQQTIRVQTVTPAEFSDLDKYLEIATIKSPYVFQAGNVKNTRFITVTKTFTKENIQPTLASSVNEATLENILATKPPYEKILEGSSDVATLPVIVLGSDMPTPPLETITQSFSTTQVLISHCCLGLPRILFYYTMKSVFSAHAKDKHSARFVRRSDHSLHFDPVLFRDPSCHCPQDRSSNRAVPVCSL